MISGSTGLNGCVDGMFVLLKSKKASGQAVLHCTGRDIEDRELSLVRQGACWVLADEREEKPPDIFVFAVHDLMSEKEKLSATATELSAELENHFGMRLPSNMVSKKLMQHWQELNGYGVRFRIKRSHGKRWLELYYDRMGDSSDGRALYPESCCPAGTRNSEKPLDTLPELGDGSAVGDGKAITGDGSGEEYFIIKGKRVPVERMSFEDIVSRSAVRLKQKIYEERCIPVPELKLET